LFKALLGIVPRLFFHRKKGFLNLSSANFYYDFCIVFPISERAGR